MEKSKVKKVEPFNPLDKTNIGRNVAEAMLKGPIHSFPPEPFHGAGIYAIYYSGDFLLYKEIAESNSNKEYNWPIYIGKAVPPGARKGGLGLGEDPGNVLYRRLYEHSKSIKSADNLAIDDFSCRYLVVDDIWIPLAENLLIEKFYPVWNMRIDGFGNHDPGKGRYEQKRSLWDTIHPGRSWADKLHPLGIDLEEATHEINSFITNAKGRIF